MRPTILAAGLCVLALAAPAAGLRVFVVAVPALAKVNFGVTDLGGGVAAITYNTTGGPVAAFALDINVSAGAMITAISDCKTADSAPGTFPDTNPADPCWIDPNTNPAAPGGDLAAVDGLGTSAITVEFGSLYAMDGPNAPPSSGTLCSITISGAGPVAVCIAVNTTRGGVVIEDANNAFTNLPLCGAVLIGATDCYPADNPHYDTWVAAGKPACWCYPTQCSGDINGDGQVNVLDFYFFRYGYFETGQEYLDNVCADFTNDGQIDNDDFFRLRDNYAKVPAANCPSP